MTAAVKNILAERRAAAIQRAAYDEETAKRLPAYLDVERKIRALSYETALDPTTEREQRLAALVAERDALLARHGLSLEPQFRCAVCRDTGYVDGRECECARELEREAVRARLRCAPEAISFANSRFEIFGEEAPRVQKLYEKMQSFTQKFDTTPISNILLTGSVGSGKTRLATCVYSEVLALGHSALWTTAFSLGNLCLDVHTSFERKDSLGAVLDADLLVVDDLGTEPIYRNVTMEYFYSVLNDRMQKRRKTLVTTNLSPDRILERYGERIFSRLADKSLGVTLSMTGKDLRLR